MRKVLACLAVLALAACAQTTAPAPDGAPPAPQSADEATAQDICGASAFTYLVGAPASGIDQTTLPELVRIITPETMATEDFRPERLNIIVGADGIVGSLACY